MDTQTPEKKVTLTVCFWEERAQGRALRLTRNIDVQEGVPVIWALGRFISFCKGLVKAVLDPERALTFRMRGAEVFWFTPVERPAVLHVYRDLY